MSNTVTDKDICEILGWEPRREWMLSLDGGKSMVIWTDRDDGPYYNKKMLEEALKTKYHKATNSSAQTAKILPLDIYPPITKNCTVAIEALQEFAKQNGYTATIRLDCPFWTVSIDHFTVSGHSGDLLPAVICEAILKRWKSDNQHAL